MQTSTWNARGSEWNRWDPHIHAPGTVLADEFANGWEGYLRALETTTPTVRALGVTDYCCISTYKEIRKIKETGRLTNVEFLFPNVEMRLDIKTEKKKGINIHLLFSPDDSDHENQVERVLSHLSFDFKGQLYRCSRAELVALGKKYNEKQQDEVGAFRDGVNQFKVTFNDLRKLFREDAWLRENCLVAVAAGEGDGTSGLKDDTAFTAIREEIERFAHLIFSSKACDREFWLGKKVLSPDEIEKKYRCLKACLHGSDAHKMDRVAEPELKRYCWIKGDLAFESLRQVIVEPEERVWIGEEPPLTGVESVTISGIRPIRTPWLKNKVVELNRGLVSVIGARGSGKTALIDLIATGAHALGSALGESSFLRRATEPDDLIGSAEVEEEWADGEKYSVPFRPPSELPDEDSGALACYLSQHFVNRLCSSAGLATELRQEIERVIFEQTIPTERFEADSFAALSEFLLDPIFRRRSLQNTSITEYSGKIADEERSHAQLPKLKNDHAGLDKQITKAKRELRTIFPRGQEQRTKRLLELEEACAHLEGRIEGLARRQQALNDLNAEIEYVTQQSEPQRLSQMQDQFCEAGLTPAEWESFRMKFSGDVKGIIATATKVADKAVATLLNGDPAKPVDISQAPFTDWPLTALRTERDKVKKAVGIDVARKQRYDTLLRSIATNQTALKTLQTNIKNAEGADTRRRELLVARREAYKAVFDTFVEETEMLVRLYEPLRQQIAGASGALGKLSFVVRREVRFDAWVEAGEKLLDLRTDTRFRGIGGLKREASKTLPLAWKAGTPDNVAIAMYDFVLEYRKDIINAMPPSLGSEEKLDWMRKVGQWLYSSAHISVQYALEYDGVEVERLSPGTRGIVLLLLYLAIDKSDRRPLLIDQPEENLDPKSVFQDLVPHFREACKRRQVIIVTHNANLVVNTDADQVIVASCEPALSGTLPSIQYESGSLENPKIRMAVCDILEGGERAFLERERRYRLRWEQMLEDSGETSSNTI
jgi:ABC-type cobalamin/Fe3+-siderophores transport system ATPase subunit